MVISINLEITYMENVFAYFMGLFYHQFTWTGVNQRVIMLSDCLAKILIQGIQFYT
jgi:hypothetical protein